MTLHDRRYTTLTTPDGLLEFQSRANQMSPRTWGNGRDRFCMLSAAIPGANSIGDCVAAGWPEWFVELARLAYDGEDVPMIYGGVSKKESNEWAERLIAATAEPVDYDLAYRRCVSEFLCVMAGNPGAARSRNIILTAKVMLHIVAMQCFAPSWARTFNPLAWHGIRTGLIHRDRGAPYAEYVAERAHGHPALPAHLYVTTVMFSTRRKQPQAVRELREAMLRAVVGALESGDAREQSVAQVGQRTTYLPFTQLEAQSAETADAGTTISVTAGARD